MAYKKIEPAWVCFDCAKKRGAIIPHGHVFTVHMDECGICDKRKRVTEPRDFGRTRSLLLTYPKHVRERMRQHGRDRYDRIRKGPKLSEEEKRARRESTAERNRVKARERYQNKKREEFRGIIGLD